MIEFDYKKIEKILNYKFNNKDLLIQAFIHPSYNGDSNANYEKLEFLGDSLLNLIISEYLFQNNTLLNEGDLTKIRSYIVSKEPLSNFISSNSLHQLIITHKDVNKDEIIKQVKIQSNIYESILGALYIDSNSYDIAKKFVLRSLDYIIKDAIQNKSNYIDYKSLLYEYCQKNKKEIKFICISDDFDQKNNKHIFNIQCFIDNKFIASIQSSSKKEGEKQLSVTIYKSLNI